MAFPLQRLQVFAFGSCDVYTKWGTSRIGTDMPQTEVTFQPSPDIPRVLIVDDDVASLDLLRRGLTKVYGYEVRTAASAHDGLALAHTSRFDLFLVDLRLPDISGLEMVRKLTDEHGAVTFVLVTGFADVPTTVEAMKLGAFTVLEKPVGIDDLGLVTGRALSDARRRSATMPSARLLQPTCSTGEAVRHARTVAGWRPEAGMVVASPDATSAKSACGEILAIDGRDEPRLSDREPSPIRARALRHDELFALAESAIEAHLSQTDLDLAAIAKLLHVSRWRLSRAFSACGADFRACLRRARMRRAARRLSEEDASSIKEVAIDVGYLHPGDFTRHFREYWGMTPTAFRGDHGASPGTD